ncbi:MAG: DNA lyase [Magnetococcales bacterium]|nr:DNA lyase [Magnetococcales bacterium]
MRLWTIHPQYLDAKGLVALWREALLAQKVLQGLTRGYVNHPQLVRFREQENSSGAIACYLRVVQEDATRRGYQFDIGRIVSTPWNGVIQETTGQLLYEWEHFLRKVATRNPGHHGALQKIIMPDPHPLFVLIDGKVREWERSQKVLI